MKMNKEREARLRNAMHGGTMFEVLDNMSYYGGRLVEAVIKNDVDYIATMTEGRILKDVDCRRYVPNNIWVDALMFAEKQKALGIEKAEVFALCINYETGTMRRESLINILSIMKKLNYERNSN